MVIYPHEMFCYSHKSLPLPATTPHRIKSYSFSFDTEKYMYLGTVHLSVGGLMQKKNIAKKFQVTPPPLPQGRPLKFPGPHFWTWILWVKLIENHINSIFPGKFVVIFLKASPSTGVKSCKGPFLAPGP